jgi:hypothetical protein
MHHKVILVFLLVLLIGISYVASMEYFANPTSGVPQNNDIVQCKKGGKDAKTMYIYGAPVAPATVATLTRCPNKAVARTYDQKVSWDPLFTPKQILDCSDGTKYTVIDTPPVPLTNPAYQNPTLYGGEIVAFGTKEGTDTLYYFDNPSTTMIPFDSLDTARILDPDGAVKPIIVINTTGYTISTTPITSTTMNAKTIRFATNPPQPSDQTVTVDSTSLYQYVSPTSVYYYCTVCDANVVSGKHTANPAAKSNLRLNQPLVYIFKNNNNRFQVLSSRCNPTCKIGAPAGSNLSYGTLNAPGAQIGAPGAIIFNPETGRPYKDIPKSGTPETVILNGQVIPPNGGDPSSPMYGPGGIGPASTWPNSSPMYGPGGIGPASTWPNSSPMYGPGGIGPASTWPDSQRPRRRNRPEIIEDEKEAIVYDPVTGEEIVVDEKEAIVYDPVTGEEIVADEVTVSDSGYDAMKLQKNASLLQNIKQLVRAELLANRNNPANMCGQNMDDDGDGNGSYCTKQGSEYNCNKPDMSKYIKKDAIPCWGCTLDY